jgi:hypothetical protein
MDANGSSALLALPLFLVCFLVTPAEAVVGLLLHKVALLYINSSKKKSCFKKKNHPRKNHKNFML